MADAPTAVNDAKIKVIAVGGGGCNAVYRLLKSMNGDYNSNSNVTWVAMNTDYQHLKRFEEEGFRNKLNGQIVELGEGGLGAGGVPEKGETIMQKSIADGKLENVIDGNEDLVIVTAGLGGGTGTGCNPLLKYIVEKSPNAVPVFIGTRPYTFEGDVRMKNADYGYKKLIEIPQVKCIIIENDVLLPLAEIEYAKQPPQEGKRRRKGMPAKVAFGYSDVVLTDGIHVVTDLISVGTDMNLDMNDAKTVMAAGPTIRFGRALSDESDDRAMNALESILTNPIYRNPIDGGSAYLIAFYGDVDSGEINEVASRITNLAQPGANIISGGIGGKTFDKDIIEIALIATGFKDDVNVGVEKTAAERKQTATGAEAAEIDEYEGGSFKLDKTDED